MADARVKERAKEMASGQGEEMVLTLTTGVRVRLHAVSSSLVEDMRMAIPEPPVPVVWIEAKEREEENPNDPRYLEAIAQMQRERATAVLDGLIMFGVELMDGLPEDDSWLKKLKLLEKMGRISLKGFDLKDEFDREFLYKRYVAVAGADLQTLAPLQSVRPQEVVRARGMFLGDEARDTARRLRSEGRDTDGDRDEPASD
jgi:hypothetical protein